MGRVAQGSLAAVGILTPAPLRARERRLRPCPRGACDDRSSATPADLGAQSDLIGAPEPMSIEAILAAPNGGYLRLRVDQRQSLARSDLVPDRRLANGSVRQNRWAGALGARRLFVLDGRTADSRAF
jgi:hypothetical protein